jgi:hypothetical protein
MQQSEIAQLFSDRKRLIETLVPIENKDRQLVPFILNPIQSLMYSESSPRDVIVKPSQVGGTSLIMCDFLLDCLMYKGTTSVIISYDEFITGRLLRKAQSFYDNLSQVIPSLPKTHLRSVSEKTFIFEDRLGVKQGESSFYIASAKGFAMPRGEPIHNLLLDELAFWPPGAAAEAFAAALNRVPLIPGTKVRALSTPNGEDNDFYDLYMSAKEGKATGKSVFKAHFYPWYSMPEYHLPADSEFVLPGDSESVLTNLNPDEVRLMMLFEKLGFDIIDAYDKLRWRRYKIAEMQSLKRSGETRLLFGQEFPEDDVTCFQSAADEWYPHEEINRLIKNCFPPTSFHLGADVWYPPEEKQSYLLCIDPGLGKVSESVATVWKFTEQEYKHCATFSGLYAGKEMVDKCIPIARWYNDAIIATEDALDITSHLANSGYPNLYYRTDPVTGMVGKDIGWQTNSSTKIYMCNELSRSLPLILTHDIRIPSQCRNIREGKSRGRVIPVSVGADDYHDSAAIAVVCRGSIQIERGYVGSKGWSDSWG